MNFHCGLGPDSIPFSKQLIFEWSAYQSISSSNQLSVHLKKKIKIKNFPPAPQQLSFFSSLWCGPLPNAVWKSTYIPSSGPSLSTYSVTAPWDSRRLVRWGFPLKKPCWLLPTGCVYAYLPNALIPYYHRLYHLTTALWFPGCPLKLHL